ncbi:MAG: HAD-IIB family hydrolase [Chitinophagales bacterium]|nr:HAD-IIB family hydrolase [Chitinophagales bacterium]
MKGLYIQLFSPHGLIRVKHPEIGRDQDTGGQVKYVLELLNALSTHPQVRKVDLFTRRIIDKKVSADYSREVEEVNEKARIIRVSCGGNRYRKKETLWDFLSEFIQHTIQFTERENEHPDISHGHYADGNFIALAISQHWKIPLISTGHSLGRNKLNILLRQGMHAEKIEQQFQMQKRIEVEEMVIKEADLIITSTQHEIDTHYTLYKNKSLGKFTVIPPGTDRELFYPYYRQSLSHFTMDLEQEQALHRISSEIKRFLFNYEKPLIVSIGRPDKRKNFETIIQAYGEDKELQSMANLAIFAGVRKEISQMPDDERETLTNLLLLLDKYDLYGKLAIPKKNDPQKEVPEIYRIAAHSKGVFVNGTPGENFGLTIVESASCGLPVIASPTGGPREIIESCQNGILTDVEDPVAIAQAIKSIISDQAKWQLFSDNGVLGVNDLYSWDVHAEKYVQQALALLQPKNNNIQLDPKEKKWFLVTDLDGTIAEGEDIYGLRELTHWINAHKMDFAFGIASGRNFELTKKAILEYDLPVPDALICSAGSEIYYGHDFVADKDWEKNIASQWDRETLEKALQKIPGIRLQEQEAQWPFKLSYYTEPRFSLEYLAMIEKALEERKLSFKVLLTENRYLDFLPMRAGKGSAVQFVAEKWGLNPSQVISAGNSGNDIDMLVGKTRGIVVGNYSPELESLRGMEDIYFARERLSKGVLEGIRFYLEKKPVLEV